MGLVGLELLRTSPGVGLVGRARGSHDPERPHLQARHPAGLGATARMRTLQRRRCESSPQLQLNRTSTSGDLINMSLCEDMLLCNYRKCRIKLSGYAWVTACSHIFCDQHGSGEFSRSPAICPACNSTLSGKLDIVRTELSPSEEYKAMVLAGLRPEIVLDISSRALAFWTYQVHQERLYQEYNFNNFGNEIMAINGNCITEGIVDNFSHGEGEMLIISLIFFLGNSSKFPLDNTPVRNQGGGDGDFQFRPFFVGSPTAPEASNSFFSFASQGHELEQQQVSSRAFKVKRI
uniref:E3 ubiquitin-protein ligase CCNB1IP1 n=1 Tax=Ictidomys tridecemlineatus TaxID=43179 RepID=UPI001A9D183D|nr:E3 ubiquitin-protein ligase CCNB1IP1 [Ictidomys tridecemlineatus]